MKPRYLLPGLAAIIAMAIAVPAFGHDQSPAAHASPHAAHHAKAPVRRRLAAAATSDGSVKATVTPLDASDMAHLMANGSVDLQVAVTGPATVSEEGEAVVGDAEETATGSGPGSSTWHFLAPSDYTQVFAPSSAVASGAGTVDLPLQLTAQGKALLSKGETFDLGLLVKAPGSEGSLDVLVPIAG